MVIFIPILVIGLVLAIFIILIQIGQICIFGKCFYIISPQFQSEFNFWMLIILWIALQVLFLYLYVKLGIYINKGVQYSRAKFDVFVDFVKKLFTSK